VEQNGVMFEGTERDTKGAFQTVPAGKQERKGEDAR
jgi:hypothetical protein